MKANNKMIASNLLTASCLLLSIMCTSPSNFAFASMSVGTQKQIAKGLPEKGPDLSGIGITEKSGQTVALNLNFKDEAGSVVPLSQYFHTGKPVILSLSYYGCPMLCGMVLNAVSASLKEIPWKAGNEFEWVNVSIDPTEKPELAAAKKANLVKDAGLNAQGAQGWHFLTGQLAEIQTLASQLGYGYRWDVNEKQYVHGAGIFVLTPTGKISRTLYGIEYRPQDMKLSLMEASNGAVGTVLDKIVLFCFQYNPHARKYTLVATRLVQAGSAGTVLFFGGFLAVFWRRQFRNRKGV